MRELLQATGTTLKRLPKRGSFDRAAIYQILDEAFVCHVGSQLTNSLLSSRPDMRGSAMTC